MAGGRSDLTLLVEGFPEQRTAVVRARGAIDEATAPQFAEFLNGRMCGTMASLVLDLSGLDSLDAAGLDAVRQTYRETQRHGIELSVVTNSALPILQAQAGGTRGPG